MCDKLINSVIPRERSHHEEVTILPTCFLIMIVDVSNHRMRLLHKRKWKNTYVILIKKYWNIRHYVYFCFIMYLTSQSKAPAMVICVSPTSSQVVSKKTFDLVRGKCFNRISPSTHTLACILVTHNLNNGLTDLEINLAYQVFNLHWQPY